MRSIKLVNLTTLNSPFDQSVDQRSSRRLPKNFRVQKANASPRTWQVIERSGTVRWPTGMIKCLHLPIVNKEFCSKSISAHHLYQIQFESRYRHTIVCIYAAWLFGNPSHMDQVE